MKKLKFLFIMIAAATLISCENEETTQSSNPIELSLTNTSTTAKTYTTIQTKGTIVGEEGNAISEKGICWSTNLIPTINDNKINTENTIFDITIENLTPKTDYYVRAFAIDSKGIHYSDSQKFSTLSLENTVWKFATYYPPGPNSTGVTIEATVNFYADGTTKYDEIGVGQGYFISYGTWSLNGNTLTYIEEGNNPANSTYVYTGTLNGLTLGGTFTHPSAPGTWTAIQL